MKKVFALSSKIARGIVRTIVGPVTLGVVLGVWAGAAKIALIALEASPWSAILVFPCGLVLIVLTGLFYQSITEWQNPGWQGVQGGHDGLHYESDDH